jgi:hypothetical protein
MNDNVGSHPGSPLGELSQCGPGQTVYGRGRGSSRFHLSALYTWRSDCATYSTTGLDFILEEEIYSHSLRRGVSGLRIVFYPDTNHRVMSCDWGRAAELKQLSGGNLGRRKLANLERPSWCIYQWHLRKTLQTSASSTRPDQAITQSSNRSHTSTFR